MGLIYLIIIILTTQKNMMTFDNTIITRAIKKAHQSNCRYKIAALGFNFKGDFIGSAVNIPRFKRKGGSIHAEMNLVAKYGTRIKTMIICRVSKTNDLLPIHPCKTCKRKLDELNIKCYTISR